MRLIGLAVAFIVSFVLAPLISAAQSVAKMHRVGLLSTAPGPHGGTINFPVLVDALRELGYEEGRNLIIERRFVRLGTDRPNDLADDLAGAGRRHRGHE